jgi:hypothetical protein
MRRITAALVATDLALAFLALCLASCLAPGGNAHACCHSQSPAISAETDGCWLDMEGMTAAGAATAMASSTNPIAFTLAPPIVPNSSNPTAAPPSAASPPRVLRI